MLTAKIYNQEMCKMKIEPEKESIWEKFFNKLPAAVLKNNERTSNYFYEKLLLKSREEDSDYPAMIPRCLETRNCWSPVQLASSNDHQLSISFQMDDLDETVIDKFNRAIFRRNDREEIRRRLAMGDDYLYNKFAGSGVERPARKPSLQSRLQSGMNLQICFMNETASDTESPSSDSESCPKLSKSTSNASSLSHSSHSNLSTQHRYNHQNSNNNNNINNNHSSVDDIRSSQSSLRESLSGSPYNARPLTVNKLANKLESRLLTTTSNVRPNSLQLSTNLLQTTAEGEQQDQDFFTKQARLQIEARMALAQAKDMAHMQMEIEKQRQKHSPITEVIRNSLEKVGSPMPPEKRRVSRQMLTDMNIAQLQVIVNELHTHIEFLNESLVQFLMERDELHMSQDSMLVDIEDLTRYLCDSNSNDEIVNRDAKEQSRSSSSLSLGSNSSQSGKNVINNNNNNNTAISTRSQLFPSPKQSRDANSNHIGGNSTASQPAHPSKFLRIASLVKK